MTAANPRTPRLRTTLPWLLAIVLATTALLPLAGALGLGAQGGGTADALWGAYSGIDAPPVAADQDLDGAMHAQAQAEAKVDAQPALDTASDAVMDAKAQAEAQAEAALQQVEDAKDSAYVGLDWTVDAKTDGGAQGALDSSADTGLHGGYDGKADAGTAQHVDAKPVEDAAQQAQVEASMQAQATTDAVGSLLAEIQAQLDMGAHAVMDLAGQAQAAVGSALGLAQATHADAHASLDAGTDVLGDAKLPDIALPQVDGAGSLTASATAAAQGIVH
jgi:hypothetical protein